MALHPVFEQMIDAYRRSGRPQLCAGSPDDARLLVAASRAALGSGPKPCAVRDIRIPSRGGSMTSRFFTPVEPPLGLIVYAHGGGWVVGALDDFDTLARTLVAHSGCALLLVDYRLAPEHPFPAGLEDVEDAIRWAAASRLELTGSHGPLIVAGDSAGANLVTVAALEIGSDVQLDLQVLFYPVTDTDTNTASYQLYGEGLLLTKADMQWFLDHYVQGHASADPRIAPLRAEDLSGAPEAWIGVAEYDVLKDEGDAYAKRLVEAGVAVELCRYSDMPHGFARMTNLVDSADSAVRDAADAIRRKCAEISANALARASSASAGQHHG